MVPDPVEWAVWWNGFTWGFGVAAAGYAVAVVIVFLQRRKARVEDGD